MTTTIETGALNTALRTLKLSGMLETIEGRLAQARAGELGHIDFLQVLCEDEITRRASMAIYRRLAPPGSMSKSPSKASISPHHPSSPPPRSATSPPSAGCTPASP